MTSEFTERRLPDIPYQAIVEWETAGFQVSEVTPTFTGCNELSRVYHLRSHKSIYAIAKSWTIDFIDNPKIGAGQ